MKHRPINIDFIGLTHNPSDYACQDGELGTCLNLIPEDRELHIIAAPKEEESFALPDNTKVVFVHKVRHGDELHTHYVTKNESSIYWLEKGASSYEPTLIYTGNVNSVTAIGNILCLIEDSSTKYAYWKEDRYVVFNLSDLNYSVTINDTMGTASTISKDDDSIFRFDTYLSDDEWNTAFIGNDSNSVDETPDPTLKGASVIFNSLDAMINKRMSELGDEWFKYMCFGVVALRLFDGTYINISNPFVLASNAISNKFLYLKSKKVISSCGYLHKHSINLSLSLNEGMKDIVQGATVFLTHSESFIDTEKAPLRITNKYNPLYNDNMTSNTCSAVFYFKERKSTLELIDSMQYYRSVDIDFDEFGKYIPLKNIQQVEDSIPLADMNRLTYGGSCAITYNNRLHLGNVKKSFFNAFDSYTHDIMPLSKHDGTFNWELSGCYLNTHVEVGELEKSCLCDAVFEVSIGDTIANKTLYFSGKTQYPLSPIVSFPDSNAAKLTIYFKVEQLGAYYKAEFQLHKSNTFGMSYYVYFGDRAMGGKPLFGESSSVEGYSNYGYDNLGLPQFIQYERFSLKDARNTVSWWQDGTTENFTKITEEEYNKAASKVDGTMQYVESSPSLIKVSEAENPIVFPAKNSVQVGSAQVKALAANTIPISEGQFGEAPLYAFTDEGVWMLMIGSNYEGTYQARQPVNRYVVTNADGILQIDNAVLYPTEQGIMLQSGSKTTCITASLDGKGNPFQFTILPFGNEILQAKSIDDRQVGYVHFRTFLEKAKMIYDYYDSRIILFNPNYAYAYVYSLRSEQWGTMESDFSDTINVYPESLAVNGSNKIMNVYNPSVDEEARYILCTRPLGFGDKNSFKTVFDTIVRGYFDSYDKTKCSIAIYASNDLRQWYLVGSGVYSRLRTLGSPYKYYRIALVGTLSADETISGFSSDIQNRWQNSIR